MGIYLWRELPCPPHNPRHSSPPFGQHTFFTAEGCIERSIPVCGSVRGAYISCFLEPQRSAVIANEPYDGLVIDTVINEFLADTSHAIIHCLYHAEGCFSLCRKRRFERVAVTRNLFERRVGCE